MRNSILSGSFGRWLRGMLALPALALAGCGAHEPTPLAIPAPKAALRVENIHPGDTGWIRLSDMYVDNRGIAWIDASAEIYTRSDARLADLAPTERAFVGTAGGYLHVSLSLDAANMEIARQQPREGRWLPARNLGAVVHAIRDGHEELALPATGADEPIRVDSSHRPS